MKNFKEFVNKKEGDFKRIDMYLEYYKNLSPKGFVVKKEEDKIIIKVK